MFTRYERLIFDYPQTTLLQSPWKFRRREIEVLSCRDLIRQPLNPQEYLRRPLIHRGRWLLSARDLNGNNHRKFYLASSRQFYRAAGLRLALYDPDAANSKPIEFLSRRFSATKRDRLILARTIIECSRCDWSGFLLRVTVDPKTAE